MSTQLGLLAIDLQPVYTTLMPDSETFLKRVQFTIEAATLLGIPTFFTEQNPSRLGGTHPEVLACAPEAPPPFAKTHFSALKDDTTLNAIRESPIDHLLLIGLESSICIYQSALDALPQDIGITILTDATASRRAEDKPVVDDALEKAGCTLLPSETVFYSILGTSDHPQFRDLLSLVKKYN